MNRTTFSIAIITSLTIEALLLPVPALSDDRKQSSRRDPLEFERASPRERLTDADKKLLEPLWKIACVRSSELKSISESLVKDGSTIEQIQELFDSVFEGFVARLSATSTRNLGIALTIPSLEPTYPVPGGQGPVYLLPAKVKHLGRSGHSSASVGDGYSAARFPQRRSMDWRIGRVLGNLSLIFQGYKSRCVTLKKLESETQNSAAKKSINDERRVALKTDRDNLRQQLADLVGEDAVRELDNNPNFVN